MRALIGYTGFVGSALLRQTAFDALYNSTNIREIRGKSFESVVCAGAPAVKWKANQNPEEDLENIRSLMNHLEEIQAGKFILISTVDVYRNPQNVDEDTPIDPAATDPYGKHRFYLEQFVSEKFTDFLIVRLPGLFGKGLKKNLIYDLLHGSRLDLHHSESRFQFYDVSLLWSDIQRSLLKEMKWINIATEPVMAKELAKECFNLELHNPTGNPPANYDMRTKHADIFNGGSAYLYEKDEVLRQISAFIRSERSES